MSPVLIVGATRGLGASLVNQYASRPGAVVYGTTRSNIVPSAFPAHVKWLPGLDLMESGAGDKLVELLQLGGADPLSTVVRPARATGGYGSTRDASN